MREQTCCFTGHRNIPENEYHHVKKHLKSWVINLVDQGVTTFMAGGALGFDTIAALAVLKLRRKFPGIRLILALPCKEQAKGWSVRDIKIYNQILKRADEVVYISEDYDQGCMYKRNRYLVDHSRWCMCYLKKPYGGTAYTVDYARKKGLKIIHLL